jgi:hypothetical protein
VRGGFILGSVVLIGMWVAFQPGVSGRVEDASNFFVAFTRRLLSPQAAGIGNHARASSISTITDQTPASGGGGKAPSFTGYFQ